MHPRDTKCNEKVSIRTLFDKSIDLRLKMLDGFLAKLSFLFIFTLMEACCSFTL